MASGAEGAAQPTLVVARTLEWQDAPDSAACRGEGCRASIAGVGGTSGSSQRRLMDFVVAPYRRQLVVERLAGKDVECTLETSLNGQRRD